MNMPGTIGTAVLALEQIERFVEIGPRQLIPEFLFEPPVGTIFSFAIVLPVLYSKELVNFLSFGRGLVLDDFKDGFLVRTKAPPALIARLIDGVGRGFAHSKINWLVGRLVGRLVDRPIDRPVDLPAWSAI